MKQNVTIHIRRKAGAIVGFAAALADCGPDPMRIAARFAGATGAPHGT